nr:CFEM domain-containing protein [Colletotrichum truncatum]KAF6784721.1 CFEM domain-containing protein [Colletotrichum truncatum]
MSTLENGHILAVEAMASLDLSTLLPGCSANCITDATISSVTSGSVNYLCSDARFSEAIGCAFQNCTVINGLKTQRILSGVCGLPVRDQGTSAAASAIAGALVAVVSVAIREYSQLSRLDYRVGLDDYALILTMSLSLPMSILVVISKASLSFKSLDLH